MAGLGVKTFNSGDTLTAAEVNGYFMDQVIAYFADIDSADLFFTTNPLRLFTGRTIYSAEDEALFVWDGTVWVNQVAVVGDGAVTSVKLRQVSGEEAVITAAIRDSAVTSIKIDDKAITSSKIGPVELLDVTASRNIGAGDYGKTLRVNSSSAVTLTIQDNGTTPLDTGTEIYVIRYGTGTVTFAGAVGVTIVSDTNRKSIKTQYSSASLLKLNTNEWLLTGNLAD